MRRDKKITKAVCFLFETSRFGRRNTEL